MMTEPDVPGEADRQSSVERARQAQGEKTMTPETAHSPASGGPRLPIAGIARHCADATELMRLHKRPGSPP
jgi:hypothetical protein